ncbi:hypothetical protein ONZ45_g14598 [Pleurotus djamor]|nr:hypothetical protein ONZ45_g14598 [Pleurotus djamor]
MSSTQQSALNLLVSAMQMGIAPLNILRDALNNGNIVVGELDGLVEALRCISSVASELADGAAQLKREEGQHEAEHESTRPQGSSYKELEAEPSQLSLPRAPSPPALFDFSGVEEMQAEVLNLDELDKIFDDFLATTASTITTTTREIIPIIVTPSRIPNQASTTTSHNYFDPRNNHYTGIDGGATRGTEPPKTNIAGLPYADNATTTTTTTNDYINGHDHSQDTNTASALTSTSYEDKGKGRATEVDQDFSEGDDTSNDALDWGSPAVDPLPSTEPLDSNDPNSTTTAAAAAVLPPPHRHDFPTPASAATLSTKETGLSAPLLPYVGSTSGVDATSALPPSANVAPPPPATVAPPPLPPAKGRKATKSQGESSTQAGPSTNQTYHQIVCHTRYCYDETSGRETATCEKFEREIFEEEG